MEIHIGARLMATFLFLPFRLSSFGCEVTREDWYCCWCCSLRHSTTCKACARVCAGGVLFLFTFWPRIRSFHVLSIENVKAWWMMNRSFSASSSTSLNFVSASAQCRLVINSPLVSLIMCAHVRFKLWDLIYVRPFLSSFPYALVPPTILSLI